mgnify:CR=1 FL=1
MGVEDLAKKYSGGGGGGSSVTVSNEANNRVITSDGSGGLVGEANATFDGTTLAITGQLTTTADVTLADGADLTLLGTAGFFRAPRLKIVALTSSTSLSVGNHAGYYVTVSGSGIVITLPNGPTTGTHFTIIASSANSFTLRTGSGAGNGDTMNGGQGDITVSQYSSVTAVQTSTNNYVVLGV